jgi:hypothetical protein
MSDSLDAHYKLVTKAIADGKVVPLLGAGVNMCGRPPGVSWERGRRLPSGWELTEHLANTFPYPASEKQDLDRVSQYITITSGSGPLYDELHTIFDADYPLTPLHQFFAGLPATLRAKGYRSCYQLIVTTNYDDVLERAFKAVGEPYELVSYIADGEGRGKFLHWPADGGEAQLIERPNEYRGLSLDQRTVILKIHGAVDRTNPERDSYVITEDHYIDYLARMDLSNLVPVTLAAKLRKSHSLFMGYSLRDYNLRVVLRRIWGEQKFSYKSWAIQLNPSQYEQESWRTRDVDILNVRLEEYIAGLTQSVQALPRLAGGAGGAGAA